MRLPVMIVSLALAASPAAAQFNAATAINTGVDSYYVADPLGWSYGGKTNLQQRRAIINEIKGWCASNRSRDMARCANALSVIRAGYAELQRRRQAEQAVAD
jgi:hypothetical protein